MESYTKKCSSSILAKVLKVQPSAKKTTSWNQAWEILATAYDLEGTVDIECNSSSFTIYKDDEQVHKITWDKRMWNDKEGDCLWDIIYKEVLNYCAKNKLFKKTKKKVSKRQPK